jgi:DNA polymerase-3 subunit gamma/tau
MSTEVWYRKWRPQRFGDVAGQEHITRTLANAVARGRLAHAYLFCGPRGTGKTSTARILAKAANCTQNDNGEPCNRCLACREVAEGRALDLIEMDAASNRGIDEIRSLRDKVGYSPTSSAYKVYLIDEVHELTAHAFDALLKTLEEPPPHVIFVLATTEVDKVPATIVSRCQRYDFRRIRLKDVIGRLDQICAGEGVTLPDGGAELIARRATGSLRDAVNLLEQVVAAYGSAPDLAQVERALGTGNGELANQLVRHAVAGDLAEVFGVIAASRDEGIEPRQLARAALDRLRALMLVKAGAEVSLELGDEALAELHADADAGDVRRVLRLLRSLAAADFRIDPLSPLPLELAIAQAVVEPETVPPASPSPSEPATSRPLQDGRRVPSGPPAVRLAAQPAGPVLRPSRPDGDEATRAVDPPAAPVPPVAEPTPVGDEPGRAAVTPEAWTPPTVDGELTLERLQGMMGSVYTQLRSQKRMVESALLNSACNVTAIDGDELTLAFAHDALAARLKGGSGEHVTVVEDAFEKVAGRRFRLRVVVDSTVDAWNRAPATARTSHLLDEAEKLGLRRVQ